MNPTQRSQDKPLLIVWWVLWAAFQGGIFTIYHFLTGPAPAPPVRPTLEPGPWMAAIAPFAVSVLIRFVVLPLMKSGAAALPIFIVGIAMAEFTCFLGIFIFPSHQRDLFILSVIGIFQFIPTYASRYLKSES